MPKIGCDFPMPDIAKHFDTTMQKKTGKTNSAVFRNLSGLHFQYILNGLPLFYDNKGKDVRNPFSPPRSQLIFPRSCGKGISMQQHRMQHCRHIWYFSQYTLSWNLTFARSRGREAFQYSTRSERSQDFQKQKWTKWHSQNYKWYKNCAQTFKRLLLQKRAIVAAVDSNGVQLLILHIWWLTLK